VRLDHLLSKELLDLFGDPRATTQAHVLRWFAQGWNIDLGRSSTRCRLVRSQLFGAPDLEHRRREDGRRARCWVLRDRASLLLSQEGGERELGLPDLVVFPQLGECAGYRPYFENYTVDASILDSDPSGSGSQDRTLRAIGA
jgi:hypothetical protein